MPIFSISSVNVRGSSLIKMKTRFQHSPTSDVISQIKITINNVGVYWSKNCMISIYFWYDCCVKSRSKMKLHAMMRVMFGNLTLYYLVWVDNRETSVLLAKVTNSQFAFRLLLEYIVVLIYPLKDPIKNARLARVAWRNEIQRVPCVRICEPNSRRDFCKIVHDAKRPDRRRNAIRAT